MSENVYLVDGSGYIFRAYYAVAPLSTRAGFPTNALYGFTRMLLKLLSEAKSNHVVMTFDVGRETFRNELYPEYKANRAECPEDLLKQMPLFREIAQALGVPILELPGYEADDVIGTVATRLRGLDCRTVIVSGDKDLLQLVAEDVTVWDTMRDRWFDRAKVEEKFGVPPEKVVEFLGLTGDSSDNIPGLKGVGPKTAAALVSKYGDVESIIARADEIADDKSIRGRKKIAERLGEDVDLLRLSRKLVEIDRAAPIEFGDNHRPLSDLGDEEMLELFSRSEQDTEALQSLVDRLEFDSLFEEFGVTRSSTKADAKSNESYRTIYAADFEAWAEQLSAVSCFAFDLETTSLDPLESEVVGASFCWDANEAFYLPFAHLDSPTPQIQWGDFLERCGACLADAAIQKVGQNLKYDVSVLRHLDVPIAGVHFDTMVAGYLLKPDHSSYNLGALAREYLSRSVSEYSDVVGDHACFSEVSVADATHYAAEDAHIAWLLYLELAQRIKDLKLETVLNDIEIPLVPLLAEIELRGMELDVKLLGKMSEEFEVELARLQQEVYSAAGTEFNLNSPKQLSEVLFEKLQIPTHGLKKTKTGTSTDSSVLEKLRGVHPVPGLILEYRSLHKLKSTYVDALPAQVSPITGRLHTRLNQTVTGTGRLSSSDPNLQNIPIQSKAGRRIRAAFVARPERVLIAADYSQIELRVLAHLSEDAALSKAFHEGADIHKSTAREILGLGEEADVSSEERRIGKTINFGVVYGMSGFRLGRELGLPVKVANEYIENYFDRYSGVRDYFEQLQKEGEADGFVTTMFGRRRVLADIDTRGRDRGFIQRAAINAPIQGSAADIVKLAMIKVAEALKVADLDVEMLLQVHDEILFESDIKDLEKAREIIEYSLSNVVSLNVPLRVDLGWGANWQEAHS